MKLIKQMFSGHKQELSHDIRTIFALALLCLFTAAFAGEPPKLTGDEYECLAINTTDLSYEVAIHKLMSISEVQQWEALVKKNKRHVSTISSSNSTVFHDGQCFWEINLYEVTDGQFLRWNAYQIGLTIPLAYRLDVVNPEQLISVKFPPGTKAGVANE
jgi:hypothetical protein